MIAAKEHQDVYFSHFREIEKRRELNPSWLVPFRKAALDRFAELGFPTTRNEEWKYTNVAPIARTAFQPVNTSEVKQFHALRIKQEELGQYTIIMVFSNGRLVFAGDPAKGEQSSLALPAGLKVSSLSAALAGGCPLLEQHFGR